MVRHMWQSYLLLLEAVCIQGKCCASQSYRNRLGSCFLKSSVSLLWPSGSLALCLACTSVVLWFSWGPKDSPGLLSSGAAHLILIPRTINLPNQHLSPFLPLLIDQKVSSSKASECRGVSGAGLLHLSVRTTHRPWTCARDWQWWVLFSCVISASWKGIVSALVSFVIDSALFLYVQKTKGLLVMVFVQCQWRCPLLFKSKAFLSSWTHLWVGITSNSSSWIFFSVCFP